MSKKAKRGSATRATPARVQREKELQARSQLFRHFRGSMELRDLPTNIGTKDGMTLVAVVVVVIMFMVSP